MSSVFVFHLFFMHLYSLPQLLFLQGCVFSLRCLTVCSQFAKSCFMSSLLVSSRLILCVPLICSLHLFIFTYWFVLSAHIHFSPSLFSFRLVLFLISSLIFFSTYFIFCHLFSSCFCLIQFFHFISFTCFLLCTSACFISHLFLFSFIYFIFLFVFLSANIILTHLLSRVLFLFLLHFFISFLLCTMHFVSCFISHLFVFSWSDFTSCSVSSYLLTPTSCFDSSFLISCCLFHLNYLFSLHVSFCLILFSSVWYICFASPAP